MARGGRSLATPGAESATSRDAAPAQLVGHEGASKTEAGEGERPVGPWGEGVGGAPCNGPPYARTCGRRST